MSRMSYEEAIKFNDEPMLLTLTNNHDRAKVKFLIDGTQDIEQFMVHTVNYEGKTKKVECLRTNPRDSKDSCPLCKKDGYVNIKYYIPLYNLTEDTFQYWERGKAFIKRIIAMCNEYYPVSNEVFEIERIGEKGDPDTDYRIYNITEEYVNSRNAKDLDFTIKDLDIPDCMSEEAGIVLEKSEQELEYYVEHGHFVEDDYDYAARESNRENSRTSNRFNSRRQNDNYNNSGYRTRYSSRRNVSNYDDESNEYEDRHNNRERYSSSRERDEEYRPRRREF